MVLPTGSFAYNDAMVAQYAPRIAGRPAASIEQHDGQAIRMAQALGADLAHMDATEVAIFDRPAADWSAGILVNGRGQRYVPEDTYSGRVGQLTLYHQDNTAYLIIDGDAQEEAMAASLSPQLMMRPADLGVRDRSPTSKPRSAWPPASCRPRSAAYNDGAARGEDPLLHKKAEWLKPIGTPVGAIDLRDSTRRFHPRRPADHAGRGGTARQRRADPRSVRRGPLHRGSGRLGLRQRDLAGRRQLLRPSRRPGRGQGLNLVGSVSFVHPGLLVDWRISRPSTTATRVCWVDSRYIRDSATSLCYK